METVQSRSAAEPAPPQVPTRDLLPLVRPLVREILLASPAYRELDPGRRRAVAEAMVRVCHTAASLLREEMESEQQVQTVASAVSSPGAGTTFPKGGRGTSRLPLAAAQSAGSDFSGVSAARVAGTTQAILNAVSFPRFVTELISGVFKAMIDSSVQQMNAYVELLNNVAASTEGFADSNFASDRARQWLADKYPSAFEIVSDSEGDGGGDGGGPPERRVQLRDGASMPSAEQLKTDLGLSDTDTVPGGDPEALVPFVRRRLAQQRQGMLATMVMLGMQRIVVESGKINAAMRFHIDTRSAAQADQGSTFSLQNQINAAGSFGFGPWGASASVSNTIGYVSTQRSQTTEEMNTDLDLNSSVEINFKSDYLPLNRMASSNQVDRIRANTLNPEAEIQAEKARTAQAAQSDQARRQALDTALRPPSAAPPAPGSPGTVQDAERARTAKGQRTGGTGSGSAAASPSQSGSTRSSGAAPGPSGPTPARAGTSKQATGT